MDYLEWVINWFQEHGNASEDDLKEHLDDNFFDNGYIDSFGFIMLMGDVEEQYGVSFDNDRFQDRSFSTINGFVKGLKEEVEK